MRTKRDPMGRFRAGMRVDVIQTGHPLEGRRGTVRHLNVGDSGAVVEIDGGLPPDECLIMDGIEFPGRTVLMPFMCREVT